MLVVCEREGKVPSAFPFEDRTKARLCSPQRRQSSFSPLSPDGPQTQLRGDGDHSRTEGQGLREDDQGGSGAEGRRWKELERP